MTRHGRPHSESLPNANFAKKTRGVVLLWLIGAAGLWAQAPIHLDGRNSHYCVFRGQPVVLLTSGEHYGALLNDQFDFETYLQTLQANRLNLTRTFSGVYREVPGNFGIEANTLAPAPGHFVCPWPRSQQAGAADGGRKFDLQRWDGLYFNRLNAFVEAAARRGIVVEFTLFCPFYEDSMWRVSPMNAANNINHVGAMDRTQVYTLHDTRMQQVQDDMVREIVRRLNQFDNVIYEICNEPYFGGVTEDWQHHIALEIADTEAALPNHHLITQNIANYIARVEHPDPLVAVLNFHYARPAQTVALNFKHQRVIGNNETGFDGPSDDTYRVEAWDFLFSGGGLFNNLDYSFAVGHEHGDFAYGTSTPGGGSARLRGQYEVLGDVFRPLDLETLRPAPEWLVQPVSDGAMARVLTQSDGLTLVYLQHGRLQEDKHTQYALQAGPHQSDLWLSLPAGQYRAEWVLPANGASLGSSSLAADGVWTKLASPAYAVDLLLRLTPNRM